eukprot:COSAG01_NODE_1235_length_11106_cov_3.058962_2_plen_400_part_00
MLRAGPHHVRVGAVFQEQAGGSHLILQARDKECCVSPAVGVVNVHKALIEQALDLREVRLAHRGEPAGDVRGLHAGHGQRKRPSSPSTAAARAAVAARAAGAAAPAIRRRRRRLPQQLAALAFPRPRGEAGGRHAQLRTAATAAVLTWSSSFPARTTPGRNAGHHHTTTPALKPLPRRLLSVSHSESPHNKKKNAGCSCSQGQLCGSRRCCPNPLVLPPPAPLLPSAHAPRPHPPRYPPPPPNAQATLPVAHVCRVESKSSDVCYHLPFVEMLARVGARRLPWSCASALPLRCTGLRAVRAAPCARPCRPCVPVCAGAWHAQWGHSPRASHAHGIYAARGATTAGRHATSSEPGCCRRGGDRRSAGLLGAGCARRAREARRAHVGDAVRRTMTLGTTCP